MTFHKVWRVILFWRIFKMALEPYLTHSNKIVRSFIKNLLNDPIYDFKYRSSIKEGDKLFIYFNSKKAFSPYFVIYLDAEEGLIKYFGWNQWTFNGFNYDNIIKTIYDDCETYIKSYYSTK